MKRSANVKRVAILVIGDEILSGEAEESNAVYLSRELHRLGAAVERILVLPDDEELVAREMRRLSRSFDAVIVTGGIGTTHDDITRQAAARAFRRPLAYHGEGLEILRRRYQGKLDYWRRQLARLPAAARLILNPRGTPPGFAVRNVYVFPGVPHMLKEMFPGVAGEFAGPAVHREVIFTKLPETAFAGPLGKIAAASADVAIGSYPLPPGSGHKGKLIVKSRDRKALAAAVRKIGKMLSLAGKKSVRG